VVHDVFEVRAGKACWARERDDGGASWHASCFGGRQSSREAFDRVAASGTRSLEFGGYPKYMRQRRIQDVAGLRDLDGR
jgi:hypothetical protein